MIGITNAEVAIVSNPAYDFATASWDDIAMLSESGQAQGYFEIGDTKEITTPAGDTLLVSIIAFDYDSNHGDDTPGITCAAIPAVPGGGTMSFWVRSATYPTELELCEVLPADLRSVIKIHNNGDEIITVFNTNDCANTFLLEATSDRSEFWVEDADTGELLIAYAGNIEKDYTLDNRTFAAVCFGFCI